MTGGNNIMNFFNRSFNLGFFPLAVALLFVILRASPARAVMGWVRP